MSSHPPNRYCPVCGLPKISNVRNTPDIFPIMRGRFEDQHEKALELKADHGPPDGPEDHVMICSWCRSFGFLGDLLAVGVPKVGYMELKDYLRGNAIVVESQTTLTSGADGEPYNHLTTFNGFDLLISHERPPPIDPKDLSRGKDEHERISSSHNRQPKFHYILECSERAPPNRTFEYLVTSHHHKSNNTVSWIDCDPKVFDQMRDY